MSGGLLMFPVLYLVQAGMFVTIPLFLSVSVGPSALETGVRVTDPPGRRSAGTPGRPRAAIPPTVVSAGGIADHRGSVAAVATPSCPPRRPPGDPA